VHRYGGRLKALEQNAKLASRHQLLHLIGQSNDDTEAPAGGVNHCRAMI